MYENIHMPVISLDKAPVKIGGLCSIRYFKKEDVLVWPEINKVTGVMNTALQLKEGSSLYFCKAIDSTRSFEEEEKSAPEGNYFAITAKGNLHGSNAANILALQTMIFHHYGLIIEDRNGVTRLVGNEDSCAKLSFKYNSGEKDTSRKTELIFSWNNSLPAPIYTSTAFNIIIGDVIITAGCLKLIQRFKVGDTGAPMNDGDDTLINALFVNKNLLVIASGLALPVEDGTGSITWGIERHIEKTYAGDTITFIGSATLNEIIEIYAWT